MWNFRGTSRPDFAETPGPGQESVWDYPRPPALAPDPRRVVVRAGALVIADTHRAMRVLETASPPTFYLPPEDVRTDWLESAEGASFCEWKGEARYWTLVHGPSRRERVAWTYPRPRPEFAAIANWFAFYPARVECSVGGEPVRPQGGGFYGGWVTDEIVGPWKGEPGTGAW